MRGANDDPVVSAAARYNFGPLEQRGLVAGLDAGQLGAVAVGLTGAVVALRTVPGPAGGLSAVALAAGCVALAFWPVGGTTLGTWLLEVGRWSGRHAAGRDRHLSDAPLEGWRAPLARRQTPDGGRRGRPVPPRPRVPRPVAHLVLEDARLANGRRIGVVHDRLRRTWTAVLPVRSQSFPLLEMAEKQRRVEGWAQMLAGLARRGSATWRVQWVERSLAGEDVGHPQLLPRQPVALPDWHPATRSYTALVAEGGRLARRHDMYVAVSVSARHAARAVNAAGGGRAGAVGILGQELIGIIGGLRRADLVVDGPLGPVALAGVIREAFEPRPSVRVPSGEGGDEGGAEYDGSEQVLPWPLASQTSWSSYRCGGARHVTYWVGEWPRVDVGPDFLSPLLLEGTGIRTIAMTMEPVDPLRAVRATESARVADIADEELRRRAGFLTTSRRRREAASVLRREAELAQGHAEYRFSAYVTVTATGEDELDAACAEVEQAASRSQLELRRLYGSQDQAFTFTLPLARGLR